MKKNVFVSKMKLFGYTNDSLAERIGLSRSRLSAKINEKRGAQFNQGEIQKLKDVFELTHDEIDQIFFSE